mmetsp:Transcript_20980/g.45940  ORF Transcript_20980/g.45940 Transcript_20980/m.45940 type:complete len:355 (+) Transcript_20980:123-1187(+)|eukprot:CAMPEP_0202908300 /NCGR_PEP_ID=MMETSP1392-20130828/45567_1 /ASSEMBLY_ACC=CAM_ASM_000868 /TAXON_ID=225041 /ORGANISM="Chlamydomonas chlamydogama, Strain SAG 11-48b" /LENGTH=354 /DNA_ID=CAMNT_0049597561 /DNA_START=32 /DNA_END=1096 /DNA_ORIENTATION=+
MLLHVCRTPVEGPVFDALLHKAGSCTDPVRAKCLVQSSAAYPTVLFATSKAAIAQQLEKALLEKLASYEALDVAKLNSVDAASIADLLSCASFFVLSCPWRNAQELSLFVDASDCLSSPTPPGHVDFVLSSRHQEAFAAAVQVLIQGKRMPDQVRFVALPASATQHVKQGMQAAGYQVSYEPALCHRFVLKAFPPAVEAACKTQMGRLSAYGLHLDSLRPEDIDQVDGTWKFQGPGTYPLIQSCIQHFPSACIRETASGRPVTWCLQREDGTIGVGHTVDEYRRLRLQSLSIHNLAHRIWGRGQQHIFCYVVQGNSPSMNMIRQLGPQESSERYAWLGFIRGSGAGTGTAGSKL